ncbi:MAG: ABC transporter ATP-binding protein [Thermonemataceae bacterium]
METSSLVTDNLLEVRDLVVEFTTEKGTIQAVKHVNFSLAKGETIGIVGESGSGKSVTSLSIMRLIQEPVGKIASGEIIFDSPKMGKVDLLSLSKDEMQELRGNDIAMIFQEPMTSLNPVYTCGNQVMEAILLHQQVSVEEAKKRTLALFDRVKLPRVKKIFNAYPHELSGGQKQRVMIAMALSCNPSLLIADEPTTALDVTVQEAILDIVQDLRYDEETSVIFITLDLGVVAEISDHVMVMYKGETVEKGDVWDIFNEPQHPYTKGLLACRPRLDFKMKVLATVNDFMEVDEEGKLIEKENNKYKSVGEALLLNFETEDEIKDRTKDLMMRPAILEVNNLKKYFPLKKNWLSRHREYVKAVDDVSFKVYPGETLGLVGESGCGKTTLGRLLLRLLEPTSGEVTFQGENILTLKGNEMRRLRKDMQIIFQDPYSSLNPRIAIGEAIMEPMRLFKVHKNDKERKNRVVELLETVSLQADHFNRYPHEFSGGQRQRICIARALALDPKFVVCDESVSALDVSVQAQVLNLLNELKEKFHFTYIFISHDLSVVKFMADRMIVMNKGKIEEMGFAEDIYNYPQKAYTKNLIKAIPKGDLEDVRKAQLRRKLEKEKRMQAKM